MKSPLHIINRLWQRTSDHFRRKRFAGALEHLHGPSVLHSRPGEVIAIVLVRNGSYYLDTFMTYYRAMGIKHFVFMDNGSEDDTIERIMQYPDTIIDRCVLPLAEYEGLMRAYPAETYGQERWCFYIDMDEVFDFEGRESHGIRGLTSYMEAQGQTALVAQMLEMFPKAALAEVADMPFEEVLREFRYFDISTVDRFDYHSPEIEFSALLRDNEASNSDIQFCFGGVRGKVFDEACCLTKHPLIFNGEGVTPAPHPHLSMGVSCADVTAVIKHYKFANNLLGRDAVTLSSGAVAHGEDAARAEVMTQSADLSLFSLDARRWNRIDTLYRAGFLNPSESYSAHLAKGTP